MFRGFELIEEELKKYIRAVPDFPKKGIIFRDVTPLLLEPQIFKNALEAMGRRFESLSVECIVGIESRGFIFGAPLAQMLDVGFALVRKPGKLPSKVKRVDYQLEYGSDTLEIHADSILSGQKVLIVDDLLATGGTAAACESLVESAGGEVVGATFLIELLSLQGRESLVTTEVHSVIDY
ncbi:adenine phosphoribosyltransferase [Myxococcota bacterium]|nr:adenine phosphoribosyltransferase [Myxococcota bacterium]|tara:strand:+ start:237 stop:776 length:540 start_codon:yes stop_codon:yes gene_type:complete